MELYEAVNKAVKQFGEQVITEPRFVSILCDYHGFDTIRPAKTIIGDAVRLGYMGKLLSNKAEDLKFSSICYDFVQETGFKKELVERVFTQISMVLNSQLPFHIELCPIPPIRQLPIVFIVDASNTISDHKASLINTVITSFVKALSFLDDNPDVEGAIACMTYGKHTHWVDESPCKLSEYKWKSFCGDGESNVSEAFLLLKNSFKDYFVKRIYDPIIILLSGSKTVKNYESVLADLSNYYEYDCATRIGIQVGDDGDMDLLSHFASSKDHIVNLHNIGQLKNIQWFRYSFPEIPADVKSFFD
jgi:uncharacterized protein YegL